MKEPKQAEWWAGKIVPRESPPPGGLPTRRSWQSPVAEGGVRAVLKKCPPGWAGFAVSRHLVSKMSPDWGQESRFRAVWSPKCPLD